MLSNRRRVLILNADLLPLTAVSWQRGMQITFEGTCITLELARDRHGVPIVVHSPGAEWDLPSVMMSKRYVSMGSHIRYSRHSVMQRDNYICQYCGDRDMDDLTIDHIRPRSSISGREGNLWLNRVVSCTLCNHQKGDRPLGELRGERCWNGRPFRLIREPFEPTRSSVGRFVRMVGPDNLEWLNYLPGWERVAERTGRGWLIELRAATIHDPEDHGS